MPPPRRGPARLAAGGDGKRREGLAVASVLLLESEFSVAKRVNEQEAINDAAHDQPSSRRATGRLEQTRMRPPGGTQSTRGQAVDLMDATHRQYLDDMVDVYVTWREACGEVSEAYANWQCAGRTEQKLAFGEYIAALDREEDAATLYQHAVKRLAATD